MRRFGLKDISELPSLESFASKTLDANASPEGVQGARPPALTAPLSASQAESSETRQPIWPPAQDEDTPNR
jgi:hypothetical protein